MSREQTARFVAGDVSQVRRHARMVFDISASKNVLVHNNHKPLLEVVAVIGPGGVNGYRFRELVLCEIGLRRTRPYTRSERRGRKTVSGIRPYLALVPPRHPWCAMSKDEYLRVAPLLFSALSTRMQDVTARWSSLGFSIKTPRLYADRKNKLRYAEHYGTYPRGCRISVSRRDTFLLADLLSAERDDLFWEKQMSGLASFIKLGFKPLESGWAGDFLKLEQVRYVREVLLHRVRHSLPSYILWELPRYLSGEKGTTTSRQYSRRKYRLLPEVKELLAEVTGIPEGEIPWQQQVASQALPGRCKRTEGLFVRDISSLRLQDDSKSHWVFELLPYERSLVVRPQVKKS